MSSDQNAPWFRPGTEVEWIGPETLEERTGTVVPGDVGTVLTDDRPTASGIVVVFNGVGTFGCDADEIRLHRET